VTATETPAPTPTPAPAPRRCPRCGNDLTPEQEWCLNCGADVGSTIAAPPSWRGPVALVVGLLLVAAVALIIALVELAGSPEQVTEQPVGQTPAPTATAPPAATSTATPSPVTIPPATDNGGAGTTPEVADWPDGKDAWTVVLESSATRTAAESRAKELAQQGVPVGILDSNGYSSIQAGKFVVFSGQYDTKRAADQALQDVSSEVTGGYVRHIIPKAGATSSPTASPTP
jgi:septal ring-binding cell division protein DamX